MLNIAVLASGGGTNLQALIDRKAQGGIKNGRLALVVASREDAGALLRAQSVGIATAVLRRKDHTPGGAFDIDSYDAAMIKLLRAHDIGLVVLAGFLTVMGRAFSEAYKDRVINVHPALIPAFSGKGCYGLRVHEVALERGVKLTGATVHIVDEVCDGGPIILQKAVEVREDDTPETLQQRVMREAEWVLLPQAVELFCDGRVSVRGGRVYISKQGRQD